MKFKEYMKESSDISKIQNAMYDKKMAKKIAKLLDISPDPDDAPEQLSMVSKKKLKDVINKLHLNRTDGLNYDYRGSGHPGR